MSDAANLAFLLACLAGLGAGLLALVASGYPPAMEAQGRRLALLALLASALLVVGSVAWSVQAALR